MAKLVFHWNAAELAGVVLAVSGEVAGQPKENLVDYQLGTPWVDSSNAGDRWWRLDLGASPTQALAGMAIGKGHNLTGETVFLESSDDAAAWTVEGSLLVPSSGHFVIRSATPWTRRYTRGRVTNPAAAPSVGEVHFALPWLAPREVSEPGTTQGRDPNVRQHVASSGKRYGAQRGPNQWSAEYLVRDVAVADRLTLETVFDEIAGGARPFFLEDADGTVRFAWWLNKLSFATAAIYLFDFRVQLVEAI